MTEQDILARVLHRDGLILVIDKPAGLPVHAGPKGGPNLEDTFGWLRFGLPRAPALAHRLDRDTSGCLILGRHRKALAKLGKLFQNGRVEKTYWAIARGVPAEPGGTIDLPLKKLTPKGGWKMAGVPGGGADVQSAVTDYRVLGAAGGLSWIECRPRTGRTHQIRVHLQSLGCPLVGDPVYGAAGDGEPMMLHARSLTIPLQASKPPVTVIAPAPPHMLAALRGCGWPGEADGGAAIGAGDRAGNGLATCPPARHE